MPIGGTGKDVVSRPGMSMGVPVRQPFGQSPVVYSGPAAQNPYLQNWHPAAPQQGQPEQPAAGGGGFSYGGGGGAPGGSMDGPPPSEMKPDGGMNSDSMQSLMQAMNPQQQTPMLGADMGDDNSATLGKGTPRNRSGALAALAGIIY